MLLWWLCGTTCAASPAQKIDSTHPLTDQACPVTQSVIQPAAAAQLALPRYVRVRVSTRILVPESIKAGTWMTAPVASVADLEPAPARRRRGQDGHGVICLS